MLSTAKIKATAGKFLLLLLLSNASMAQTWRAGAPGPNLLTISSPAGQECSVTWYDPVMLNFPNGDLGFYAQGNNPRACSPAVGIDSLYKAQRNSSTLVWQTPSQTACPALTGKFLNGSFPACPYSQTNPGPLASPDVVKVNNKYYMAFSGGNSDIIRGQIFWAYSTDAVTWTVLQDPPLPPGFTWRPLVQPKYGDPCALYGIGHLTLTYDPDTTLGPEGAFYIHFMYKHPTDPITRDMWAYRFPFSSMNASGIGGGGQLCIKSTTGNPCNWVNHSGKLFWDYDQVNGQTPEPGDPVLFRNQGMYQMANGGGDILWDPSHNYWLRVLMFGGVRSWQSATSLSTGQWSAKTQVDMSAFHSGMASLYPSYSAEEYIGGLYYGTFGQRTGMWMWVPVDYGGCSNPFSGLGIVSTGLNFN
ncbi:MAG TPA: hypothetical protein VHC97_22385 [Thermoanaerobaculia bacterium]|jgi:hypothetical protein|nr:hypothetical protein [Thermoanaerobaculia bacterium]